MGVLVQVDVGVLVEELVQMDAQQVVGTLVQELVGDQAEKELHILK